MGMSRFLLIALILTSTTVLITAEGEAPVDDDVDRTDFSDPSLNAELDKARLPTGPHSEVESASMLVDLVNGKVPVGATSYLLVSLANLGPKMFNVSAITGILSSADGKEVQAFPKKQYGDPLGPREQRSVLYGFAPKEETPLGPYKLEFKIFYNNRDKDQFVDTVFSEATELVPKPPNRDAQMRLLQMLGGGALMLVPLLLLLRPKAAASGGKPVRVPKVKAVNAVGENEWLASTMAGSENQSPKKRKEKKR